MCTQNLIIGNFPLYYLQDSNYNKIPHQYFPSNFSLKYND